MTGVPLARTLSALSDSMRTMGCASLRPSFSASNAASVLEPDATPAAFIASRRTCQSASEEV